MELSFINKRVIITGADGFIGWHLVKELIRLGARVYALIDKDSHGDRLRDAQNGLTIYRTAKWQVGILKNLFKTVRPQIIFHLRAVVNPTPGAEQREYFFQINVEETKALARAALELPLESFIHVGTIAEYGATSAPFNENSETRPISAYGESKLAATNWLKSFYEECGFPAVLLRSSVVYGPTQKSHSYLIPGVIVSCLKKENFYLRSAGLSKRDPLFLSDEVRGLLLAAVTPPAKGEIINLGLGKPYAIRAIANLINKQFGNPITIIAAGGADNRDENNDCWHDISNAERLLGWRPRVSLEAGLKTTIAWYKKHYLDFA